ncbi:hypothetical protein ACJ2CR_03600 [Myxococcus faecalis]|uniref:hypothetical protein n=1 Tax=Myxococcus faecalis TaxID=3115646 RepID=UPI0038D122D0
MVDVSLGAAGAASGVVEGAAAVGFSGSALVVGFVWGPVAQAAVKASEPTTSERNHFIGIIPV